MKSLLDTGGANATIARSTSVRLTGAALRLARAVWLILVLPGLGFFLAGLPAYYQQLQMVCSVSDGGCGNLNGSLSPHQFQALLNTGLPPTAYALLMTIFFALATLTWCAVGFLLFWRRSDDWQALVAAFFLVMTGVTLSNNSVYALLITNPGLDLPISLIYFLAQISLCSFLLFFPNGRLVSRWMILVLLLNIFYAFVDNLPSKTSPFDAGWPYEAFYVLVNLAIFVPILFSHIYRYRRISTPVQRQQTRWVIFGVFGIIGTFIVLLITSTLVPSLDNTFFWQEIWTISLPIAGLLVPLTIGFSIARYRLYDIDTLINRTLVYSTLTLLLVLIYAGLVVGFSAFVGLLFPGETGQSPAALVVSTLTIAALFRPLFRRIQSIIDRRFYRRKYDAAKTVEAFGTTLRNEVNLQQIQENLLAVVQETMQPGHVSLWLFSNRQGDEHKR
jgi:hypothetical protein